MLQGWRRGCCSGFYIFEAVTKILFRVYGLWYIIQVMLYMYRVYALYLTVKELSVVEM